ncbi:MAG: sulfotransferase [Gemmatimonadota bacterium]
MSSDFENRYSLLDRALHRIAFRTAPIQVDLNDLEDRLFAGAFEDVEVDRPVFVTGLPRAGTTLMLELLVESGGFASHTYRDMPFVLVPLLWSRFSGRFRTGGQEQERAHGDGMMVGPDSPEAFEEIVWKAHWKERYRDDRILPWDEKRKPAFDRFMTRHVRKIVGLRRGDAPAPSRYVSKNNLNIARLPYLLALFDDARIVVPFRDPLEQAASLLRQHVNFLDIHRDDPFARRYMEGIGHHDFGESLKPVDFGGWIDEAPGTDPTELSFWLQYWVSAYRHLLEQAGPRAVLVSYDGLCREPDRGLQRLVESIDLDGAAARALLAGAARIGAPSRREVDASGTPASVVEAASALHAELIEAAGP